MRHPDTTAMRTAPAIGNISPFSDVLFVVPQLEPRSGMEHAALQLAGNLGRFCPVTLLVLSGAVPGDTGAVRHESLHVPRRLHRLGTATVRLRSRLLQTRSDTIVIAVGLWAAIPVLIACPRGRRVIVWEHSLSDWRTKNDVRVRLLGRLAKLAYRRAAIIVAVSEVTSRFVREFIGSTRVTCIPNEVVELAHATLVGPPTSRTLAYVGSLNKRKNLSLALRALALITDQEVSLVVAGDGPYRRRLEREVARLGLSGRVTFLGHVSDVGSVIAGAGVIVHPALDETFGFAVVEAAQWLRPIIVLDRPNMNELVPRYAPGVVVEGETPERFAIAIAEALSREWSPELFDDALVARRHAFGSENVRKQWTDVIAAVD